MEPHSDETYIEARQRGYKAGLTDTIGMSIQTLPCSCVVCLDAFWDAFDEGVEDADKPAPS